MHALAPTQAIFKLIPKEALAKLPGDENTPEKRANKLWAFFEKKDNGKLEHTHTHTQFTKGHVKNSHCPVSAAGGTASADLVLHVFCCGI